MRPLVLIRNNVKLLSGSQPEPQREHFMFISRKDAATQLVTRLNSLESEKKFAVFTIPRGGVPIGAIVARALYAPLDAVLIKKVEAPTNKELVIGAVAPYFFFIEEKFKPLSPEQEAQIADIQSLLRKRELIYHRHEIIEDLSEMTAVIVDDGISSGHTMYTAIQTIKPRKPAKIIIATPVISIQAAEWLKKEADEVISILTPGDLTATSTCYQNFEPVSDQEALNILQAYKIPRKEGML